MSCYGFCATNFSLFLSCYGLCATNFSLKLSCYGLGGQTSVRSRESKKWKAQLLHLDGICKLRCGREACELPALQVLFRFTMHCLSRVNQPRCEQHQSCGKSLSRGFAGGGMGPWECWSDLTRRQDDHSLPPRQVSQVAGPHTEATTTDQARRGASGPVAADDDFN